MKLHIFTADIDQGYEYHHTVEVAFDTDKDLLLACVDIIGNMHALFATPVVTVTMSNKTVTLKKNTVDGIMITAAGIPYSCFAEGPRMETDGMYIYDPTLPTYARKQVVPEC